MSNRDGESCIVLLRDEADRSKSLNINQRLFRIHIALALLIFMIFTFYSIHDPDHIEALSNSNILTFTLVIISGLSAVLFFASLIMWIPAGLYAKTIWPEMFICKDWLIYSAGSKSLNYQGIAGFYPFFKYLLGYDSSQRIRSDEIISINIQSPRFLSPGFSSDTQLIIKHKHGEIIIGRWLDLNEQKKLMDCLEKWRQEFRQKNTEAGAIHQYKSDASESPP